MRVRSAVVGAAAVIALCAFTPPAAGEPAAAIVEDQGIRLWLFDTANPGAVSGRLITGIGAGEQVHGIDTRPATGQVYIWTATDGSVANSPIRSYTLDIATGEATFVGVSPAVAGAADVDSAFDFQPIVDRVRYGNANDENFRLFPSDGGLAGDDSNLTPAATTRVIASAYDRNRVGSTATTLYVIDENDSMLGRQGGFDGALASPNGGAVVDLAPLGFTLSPGVDGGFDVSPSGVGYAALTSTADDVTRLYTIALPREPTSTPVATVIGPILDGGTRIAGLTILDDDRDQDGVLTSADRCPAEANATADGCVAQPPTTPPPTTPPPPGGGGTSDPPPVVPTPALSLSVSGVASRVSLSSLRRSGLLVTATPNLASSLTVELRGTLRGTRLARPGDIVLAERSLRQAAGARRVRLRLSRANRARLRRGVRLRAIVTATDALGRTTKVTRNLRVR